MKCSKCDNEILEGEKNICDECEKKLLEEIKKEEAEETKKEDKEKKTRKKESIVKKESKEDKKENKKNKKVKKDKLNKEKENKRKSSKIIYLILIVIIIIAAYIVIFPNFSSNIRLGNSIGNIRNYGYMAENGRWIYFVAPDDKGEKMCIYKVRKNGKDKEIIFSEDEDILGLNIYKNKIYFITVNEETKNEDDIADNKINKMNLDGSELKVINDNQFNNDSYEIYVLEDKIYYIGEDANIYTMDLEGENKKVINDDQTGFLGITEKYIIFNVQEKDEDGNDKIVTYSMNLNGENRKSLTGERLYSVNIVGDEVYYVNEEKQVNKINIKTGEKAEISKTSVYNMNISNNSIYFMNYCDEDYNIAIYKMKLDGTNEEMLLKLDSYSTFLDVIGNKVLYMDSNNEKGVINLLDGKTKDITNLYEYIFSTTKLDSTPSNTTDDTTNK